MQQIYYSIIVITLLLIMVASKSWAQDASPQSPSTLTEQELCEQKPWYCDTTPEGRKWALELFVEGDRLHNNALLAAAATKYLAALEHWNHPRIHYYLMLALVKLDKPVEAYAHVIEALRYDAGPLEGDEYATALDHQKRLQDRVAEIEVICEQVEAVVTLNGSLLFTGPRSVRHRLLPGKYEIRARKHGYIPAETTLVLEPGQTVSVRLTLLPDEDKMITKRRWSSWKPWLVIAAGASLGAMGAIFHVRAQSQARHFETILSAQCPDGCRRSDFSDQLRALENSVTWQRRTAEVSYLAAAAALVGGGVLLYLNRSRQVENPALRETIKLRVAPHVGPGIGAISVSMAF